MTDADRSSVSRDLVYGIVQGSLVFIPRAQAEDLAATWKAIATATTWGEFRAKMPPKRCAELLVEMMEEFEKVPRDDEPFSIDSMPAVSDGDYPEWPAHEMLRWVPRHIVKKAYSKVASSRLNGNFLTLAPDREGEIVADFLAAGFGCEKNQALVGSASGAGGG